MPSAHRSAPRQARALVVLLWSMLVVGLSLTACSRGTGAVTTVNVQALDYAFAADKASVPAGRVHFVFQNQSTANEHELWVYPQTQPRLQEMVRAKEAGEDVEEKDYLQSVAGDVEDVPPGATQSFDATLAPGTYEFGCFITSTVDGQLHNHYAMGMHTLLTVTAG